MDHINIEGGGGGLGKFVFIGHEQEKMRGQRGRLRALAGICYVHESYF